MHRRCCVYRPQSDGHRERVIVAGVLDGAGYQSEQVVPGDLTLVRSLGRVFARFIGAVHVFATEGGTHQRPSQHQIWYGRDGLPLLLPARRAWGEHFLIRAPGIFRGALAGDEAGNVNRMDRRIGEDPFAS
jgi:hypothetical protein